MPSITVVTTFHPEGYTKYGQRFLESFASQIDKRIRLLVYAEGCKPVNPDPTRITIYEAEQVLPKLNAFKQKWKDVPKANGDVSNEPQRRTRKDWDKKFKWDAVRFANKVYAVFDACEKTNKDWVVWMDADTFVHSRWHYEDFINLLPKDTWLTYVGRGKGSQTWPECGFYGMNLNNNICKGFLKEFELYYEQAEQGIFTLDEWHDSYVFGHILNKMKGIGNVLDYSAEMYLKEAKSGGGGHPLINGVLGKWIDHMKGGRKDTGKSSTKDLMVNRTESYWTNK